MISSEVIGYLGPSPDPSLEGYFEDRAAGLLQDLADRLIGSKDLVRSEEGVLDFCRSQGFAVDG